MEIFIGSSREHLDVVRLLEGWLKTEGHRPLAWDQPGLFPPGHYTFDVLTKICRKVDAAVLVFGEDDRVWYRGDNGTQPRDNVLIEYGLFAGVLGRRKAIVCKVGKPRVAVDLAGLTVISAGAKVARRAKTEIVQWARKLRSKDELEIEPADSRQPKLVGRWSGTFEQPDYPGGPLSVAARVEFDRGSGALKGNARVKATLLATHRSGPRDVIITFDLSGGFQHSDLIKLEYRSADPGIVQFGSMMLELNPEGTRLDGRFVGYGSISESIISGIVALTKIVPRRPNSHQASSRQGQRSLSSGRPKPKRRESKRDW